MRYVCSRISFEWNEKYEGLLERWEGGEIRHGECKRLGDEGIKCE